MRRNTANTLILDKPHGLKSIASYRVEYNPSRIRGGDPNNLGPNDSIVREEKVAPGPHRDLDSLQPRPAGQEVTGKYLKQVRPDVDDRLQPAVRFEFDSRGASRFGTLTREHKPEEGGAFRYQLAILLDNLVMSAPAINSEIRDSGIIEGGPQGFKAKEVEHLIQVLRAGSLPASLNPTPLQEEKVGPTLGEDTIAKGVFAIWVSLLGRADLHGHLLPVRRHRGGPRLAREHDLARWGRWPLSRPLSHFPGLAGLALTIGMAVDANVLVFERMREEKERGASLAQQIRNGFNRAWVTIFDSHVTNFLAAIVLYVVGTEEVKGFALDDDHRHGLEPLHGRLHVARDLRGLLRQGLAQERDDAQADGQDQLRLHRPALLLHGGLADLDRAGPDRDGHPRPGHVQYRLHRRNAGHDSPE